MFSRIEVSLKPEFIDPVAVPLLRRMEMTDPHLRKMVRWARCVEVYWLEVPLSREELIFSTTEVLWDPVLKWLFTGNLIPSAAGLKGTVEDLLETAPNRPGKFFAIEKRFRIGVTDHPARTLHDALGTVLKRKLEPSRISSGQMLLLEGPGLTDDQLARIARDFFSNELLESWTLLSEREIMNSDRFHPERVKREMPRAPNPRFNTPLEKIPVEALGGAEIGAYSRRKGFHLGAADLQSIREYLASQGRQEISDVELEILSRFWGDRQAQRWIRSPFRYTETADGAVSGVRARIPTEIHHLLKETLRKTALEIPRSWVLSAEENVPALVNYDEEDALSVDLRIESLPVVADAHYGTMMGVCEAALKSATAGMGAKPIALTNVIFTPDLYAPQATEGLHPRRILDGIKQGLSDAGSQLGVPTVNGALYLDARPGSLPIVHVSAYSIMPRVSAGHTVESRDVSEGDVIFSLGNRVGKDGLVGAPPVQIVDTVIQKQLVDLIVETRDQGFSRAAFEVGTGGLAHALSEIAIQFGGADIRLDTLPAKQSGLRPLDLIGSETLERMVIVVSAERRHAFEDLCTRRGVEFALLGYVRGIGRLKITHHDEVVADLDCRLLRDGAKNEKAAAVWQGGVKPRGREYGDFGKEGIETLLRVLSHPNVASREWLVRQIDHEVQGTSALKPLHTIAYTAEVSQSGPNDGGVLKPKPHVPTGLVLGTGTHPRMGDVDPYLMGQMAVDEAIRNGIASGAEYGKEENLFALTYQISWPTDRMTDPVVAGLVVRACFGARDAALALQAPFISGVERSTGAPSQRMNLVVQSVSRMSKIGNAKSVDFKSPGDAIYVLGPCQFGLKGSLVAEFMGTPPDASLPEPSWDIANRLYAWLGGSIGKEQKKLRSVHDVSDGGILAAISESLVARGLGATLQFPEGLTRTLEWEFLLGEGFHNFVVTVGELDTPLVEAELQQNEIPFVRLGVVAGAGVLQVKRGESPILTIETKVLRQAWKKEGYWE